MNILKIGDSVVYRPSFGDGPPTTAKVESLTLTEIPRDKYGENVPCVHWLSIEKNMVCLSLDNGSWAYSYQVDVEKSKRLGRTG